MQILRRNSGVTLLETIIGVAIMGMIAFSVYQGFLVLLDTLNSTNVRVAATDAANEELEIIRNMPYQNIGTVGGVPNGFVPQVQTKTKNGITFTITASIRNIDDPFDGILGGDPNDLSPADYKLVELELVCVDCADPSKFTFTGRAAPKALETESTNGALFVRAIDANGLPVSGATVNVTNTTTVPQINITDTTGTDGFLKIVDVLPAIQTYGIIVSKTGYSTDATYEETAQNPNPTKLPLTVVLQTITQSTFSIDKVSTLNVSSLSETCSSIPGINFTLNGANLIGNTPDILKYSEAHVTNGSGLKSVTGLEWDNYSATFVNAGHEVAGTIPLMSINLLPDSSQDFKIILETKNPLSLLVTAKDSATSLPLASVAVTLTSGPFNKTLTSGRGTLTQTDWSGGSGQTLFVNPTQYFAQDNNIDETTTAGEMNLKILATSTYATSGWLTSSTFDTGSLSNFFSLTSEPTSQPSETGSDSVKFQLASATTTNPASWLYLGPDGTDSTFYTATNTNTHSIHNGDRYFRYKAYLSTASSTFTPTVTDVSVTFASDCVPPGQVFYSGLANDTYNISLVKSGYVTINDVVTVNKDWQEKIFSMNPE
jgi:hypothetical protein